MLWSFVQSDIHVLKSVSPIEDGLPTGLTANIRRSIHE